MAKAAETAYARIRAGILNGEFGRGQRLREEKLALQAGVSRTPVREALRRLAAEGLVEFIPNRGARVTAWSGQELDDLYDIRALLESYGAKLAARRARPEELAELETRAKKMDSLIRRGASPADELMVLNGDFHRLIVQAARSPQLDSMVRGIMDVPSIYRTFHRYSPSRMRASGQHHLELVEAIRTGDGDRAEAVMRAHILAAKTAVRQSIDDEQDVERAADRPAGPS